MPLFHANGLFMQLGATILAGASAVLRPRFSASSWTRDVREHRCTVSNLLGSMSEFVIAQPPRADDRELGLRVVCPVPNPPAHEAALAGALRRARGRDGIRHDGGQHPALRSVGAVAARHGRARPRPVVRGGGARPGHRRGRAERNGRGDHGPPAGAVRLHGRLPPAARDDGRGVAQLLVPHRRLRGHGRRGLGDLRRPHQGLHPPARREHLVLRGRERCRGARGRRRGGRLRRALGPCRHRGRGHARRRPRPGGEPRLRGARPARRLRRCRASPVRATSSSSTSCREPPRPRCARRSCAVAPSHPRHGTGRRRPPT